MNNWNIYDTSIQTSSDERLKKDIEDSKVDALSMINALSCKEFRWRKDDSFEELGFIAQQVGTVNPKFIGKQETDGDTYYTLNLLAMIPYLVKAIQELSKKIGVEQPTAVTNAAKPAYLSTVVHQAPKPIKTMLRELDKGQVIIFEEEQNDNNTSDT